ncbi:hypothetical protein RFI_00336, partial [Reticulomyxa filosa]
ESPSKKQRKDPKDVDENHYEIVEDEIKFKVAISKPLELDDNYVHLISIKAQGSDNIHNQMLKNGGNAMIDSLLFLFGWSFRIGYMPITWKKAIIMPIHKPDRDHSQCKNHRAIALLNEKQLLHQTQAGFQSWHNTDELLLRLTDTIHKSFDYNSVSCAVLLDISAAYDSLYWWIDSFLLDRLGRVILNGIHSEWMELNTGAPQGSALSPVLFLLYIDDLPTVIQQPILLVDDLALCTSTN